MTPPTRPAALVPAAPSEPPWLAPAMLPLRERRWAIEWSRRGVAVSYRSTGEPLPPSRGRGVTALALVAGIVGVSALASASLRPPAPRTPYRVAVAVPPAPVAAKVAAAPVRKRIRHAAMPVEAVRPTPAGDAARFAAAMATGEMQEWVGSDGAARYLVPGPADADRCRDLALLVRAPGGDQVTNERRCDGQGRAAHSS